jgi:hypothetical protein
MPGTVSSLDVATVAKLGSRMDSDVDVVLDGRSLWMRSANVCLGWKLPSHRER